MRFHVRLFADGNTVHGLAWSASKERLAARHAIWHGSSESQVLTHLRVHHGVIDPIVTQGWAGEEEEEVMPSVLRVH